MATMSLTVFLALCILGLDFMIYVLFQWTCGDKRRAIARRVAASREAARAEAAGLIFVPARKNAQAQREPNHSVGRGVSSIDSKKFFPRTSDSKRIA